MYKSRYKRASTRLKKKNRTGIWLTFSMAVLVPVLLMAGVVFVLRADFLQIKDFEISGGQTVADEEVRKAGQDFLAGYRFFLIPKSNLLLFNKEQFSGFLLSRFNRLQEALVDKKFIERSIELTLAEREGEFLWCSDNDECFLMTADGFVFEKADMSRSAEAARDKIRFTGILEGDPLLKKFASPETMKNYAGFLATAKNGGLSITAIKVESADKAVAQSSEGQIIFNPTENSLSTVAENAILLINEVKSKNPAARFEYLDARFGNKIFYKLR